MNQVTMSLSDLSSEFLNMSFFKKFSLENNLVNDDNILTGIKTWKVGRTDSNFADLVIIEAGDQKFELQVKDNVVTLTDEFLSFYDMVNIEREKLLANEDTARLFLKQRISFSSESIVKAGLESATVN